MGKARSWKRGKPRVKKRKLRVKRGKPRVENEKVDKN